MCCCTVLFHTSQLAHASASNIQIPVPSYGGNPLQCNPFFTVVNIQEIPTFNITTTTYT